MSSRTEVGRKEVGTSQEAEGTLVWHSGQVGEGLETGRDQMVCGLVRNDEEVWIFPKGKAKLGKGCEPRNACDLIYVFKRISLALLWKLAWRGKSENHDIG